MDYFRGLPQIPPLIFYFILVWSLLWKGLALWRAAKGDQRNWFVIILVLNTAGILEIAYLFIFSKNKLKLSDLKIWEQEKTDNHLKKTKQNS